MTYILMVWTIVAATSGYGTHADWRPIGEFHSGGDKTASLLCEEAASKLGLKAEKYRCVRNK